MVDDSGTFHLLGRHIREFRDTTLQGLCVYVVRLYNMHTVWRGLRSGVEVVGLHHLSKGYICVSLRIYFICSRVLLCLKVARYRHVIKKHRFTTPANINHYSFLLGTPSYSNPFLANSIFRAVSPALYPPLEAQIRFPSANSTFSSCASHGQGQWCGKCTQARVSGQR